MNLQAIEIACGSHHLSIMGMVQKGVPDGIGTLVLLGPAQPKFWDQFTGAPEYRDGQPDSLDRWSVRIITGLANKLGAAPYFPFGGPPYQPFIQWARASGRAHVSPVGLLVHDEAGLMVSYRGALGFSGKIDAPAPPPSPCISCKKKPCLSTCPVDALQPDHYDVQACKTDLDRPGNDCMAKGCAVRRACPVSRSYGRLEEQSAFHMAAFK